MTAATLIEGFLRRATRVPPFPPSDFSWSAVRGLIGESDPMRVLAIIDVGSEPPDLGVFGGDDLMRDESISAGQVAATQVRRWNDVVRIDARVEFRRGALLMDLLSEIRNDLLRLRVPWPVAVGPDPAYPSADHDRVGWHLVPHGVTAPPAGATSVDRTYVVEAEIVRSGPLIAGVDDKNRVLGSLTIAVRWVPAWT